MWYPGGGKNGWNLCGAREKRVEPVWGKGKTRGIIAQNPRKARGVHALRGHSASLMIYNYLHTRYTNRHVAITREIALLLVVLMNYGRWI